MTRSLIQVIALSFAFSLPMSAEDHPGKATEVWTPVPPVVDATPGRAPSDAIVLFDGRDLDSWVPSNQAGTPWTIDNGAMLIPLNGKPTEQITKRSFGDVQLHIEWLTPMPATGSGQGRGNSGIFFMGLYELQILDSYQNPTYSNGQAASVYKEHSPLVNASRPPGEWQVYDVVFIAPKFDDHGVLLKAASMTVFHNGVLVQYDVKLTGPTPQGASFRQPTLPIYQPHAPALPLMLQNHSNPVAFRNIWIRDLAIAR